jgi:hypothetical protein
METTQLMNWQSFRSTIALHTTKHLQFKYADDQLVDASYHITEIKQAPITSVDCGGVMNAWTEIIVQLWEPSVKDSERAMTADKAISIIQLVEKAMLLNPVATVKIEFGNSEYDTRQMYPGSITVDGDNLVVDLRPDFTQCKAIDRGQSCGTTATGEECCVPAATTLKPLIQLKSLASTPAQTCEPGSGCC